MRFHIPIKLPSLANISHLHWSKLAAIAKIQKAATAICLKRKLNLGETIPPLPLLVTITRIGPRALDDDNLTSAGKFVRDQIASIVGVDDKSNDYTWRYEQKRGKYGVDIEITSR